MSIPTEKEKIIICNQLNRNADNLIEIARYCPFSKPAVLTTYPYHSKKGIFPTIYWLSCSYLVKEVSKLEDRGLIKRLTQRLKTDIKLSHKMKSAHKIYAAKRFAMLTKEDKEDLIRNGKRVYEVIKESGIGGIKEQAGVKCLHAHLADFLVGGKNPIGKIIWEKITWPAKCDMCEMGDKKDGLRGN